jgi:hypothetical protein
MMIEMMTKNPVRIIFYINQDLDVVRFEWSSLTFTWSDEMLDYLCSSWMCKDALQFCVELA